MEAALRVDFDGMVQQIQHQRLMLAQSHEPAVSASVVHLTPPAEKFVVGERDLSRTLDLLLGAGLELRDSDQKVRDAEARVEAAMVQIQMTQDRAEAAERRVDELEGWLRKIFTTATENLSARS